MDATDQTEPKGHDPLRTALPMCILCDDGVWREVRRMVMMPEGTNYLPSDGSLVGRGIFIGIVPCK